MRGDVVCRGVLTTMRCLPFLSLPLLPLLLPPLLLSACSPAHSPNDDQPRRRLSAAEEAPETGTDEGSGADGTDGADGASDGGDDGGVDSGGGADTGGGADGGDGGGDDGADDGGDEIPDVPGPLQGIDISHWNPVSDWSKVADAGIRFAVVKATEGTYYTDDEFPSEYNGSADVGIIRGAYHFAIPDDSGGAEQAAFFVDNGGDWSPDGITLPGTLDIEYNPYGDTCYGLSQAEMREWVHDFNDEYFDLTGRYPLVYSTANWWDNCVGSTEFAGENPLWVAHYTTGSPSLPDGWSAYTFWQYTSSGDVDGISGDVDLDVFDGSLAELVAFADDE